MADDQIYTSDYSNLSSGPIRGRLGRERKDGSRGRARMSIEIQSEVLVHQFDELQLGHGPALAAAQVIADKIRGITEQVAPSTAVDRKYKEAAYQRGEGYAVSRNTWRGTKSGPGPVRPGASRFDQGLRKFNFSGTFADGIAARENKTDRTWTINVPANRLDPRTSRNAAEFAFITDALRRLVPELDDPAKLLADPRVNAAIDEAVEQLVINAAKYNEILRRKVFTAQITLGGAINPVPAPFRGIQKVLL